MYLTAGTFEGQKRVSDLMALVLQVVVSCLMWVLENTFGPLEEQQVI